MKSDGTLLMGRNDVAEQLPLGDCIEAVEEIFRLQGEGKTPPSQILSLKTAAGGLHVKAGLLPRDTSYIVAKLNSNFPNNRTRFNRPTIQGLIAIFDAENGSPLAILDSIDVTIKRTAAASAVAAKYLARMNSLVGTVCGCGQQGRAQLRAIRTVLPLQEVYAFDSNFEAATIFAAELSRELKIDIEIVRDPKAAIRRSDVLVTSTTATEFFVHKEDVRDGAFIAAVGADDTHKQELDPALMASAKVVADSLEQSCTIGDTHHAIARGLMSKENVYADLGEIVVGKKSGRVSDNEIIIFDSTGIAIEDAAAAALVYAKASARGIGNRFAFAA
jgi:alanine dehydrogenase